MLATLLASLLLTTPAPDITFDHILALPPLRGGSRTPFRADPVLAATMTGLWHTPVEGDKIGEREWKSLSPDKDGLYEDNALAGGYAIATFDSPDDAIMILEASGHTMVYVNPTQTAPGEMHTGDPYENGSVRVPIHPHKGTNTLLFATGRGHLRLKLTTPPAPIYVSNVDPTLPDLLEGSQEPVPGAVVIINATDQWQRDLTVRTYAFGAGEPTSTTAPPIPPLSVRKVPVTLATPPPLKPGQATFDFAIHSKDGDSPFISYNLRVRTAQQTRKVTFRSAIDDTIQYFGYNPVKTDAAEPAKDNPALILSLHGASVEAAHQAECYTLKPWAALAAPTNRREYGFDWEDWGRLDALEVLAQAKTLTKPDLSRIYLTGHSMGGHGTWLIGSTYPGMFAAIAPSAGWTTFWSYGGAEHFDKDPTPIQQMFRRAMNPGDTIGLARNLINDGVYVLHGDVDDNVPVEQARTMRKLLAEFHPDFVYHEQPGANHWWGNECMDWPPLMEFLQKHTIPAADKVTHVRFTTANPAVSSRCYWATIVQQHTQGDFSSINLTAAPDVKERGHRHSFITGTATNVAVLALDLSMFRPEFPATIELDNSLIEYVHPTPEGLVYFKHTPAVPATDSSPAVSENWTLSSAPPPTEKSPQRSGPFKHAFNHHTLLVYGTHGTPDENAWMLAKARYDAETIYYRGNGAFDIVADADFKPADYPDRSIIIYGNTQINTVWPILLADSPLTVHEGGCFLGEHEFKKDSYATLFVRPRTGEGATPNCLIGAVGITDIKGARAVERLNYFSSGIAYPDWTIFSNYTLTKGMEAVEGAGFFGNDWGLDETQSAWLNP